MKRYCLFSLFACSLMSLALIFEINLAHAEDAPKGESAATTPAPEPATEKAAPPKDLPIYTVQEGWVVTSGKLHAKKKALTPPVDVRKLFGPEQKIATEVSKDGKPVYLIQPDGTVLHFEVTEMPETPEIPGPRLRAIVKNTTLAAAPLDFTGCTATSRDIETGLILAETDWVKGQQTLFQYSSDTIAKINEMLRSTKSENK